MAGLLSHKGEALEPPARCRARPVAKRARRWHCSKRSQGPCSNSPKAAPSTSLRAACTGHISRAPSRWLTCRESFELSTSARRHRRAEGTARGGSKRPGGRAFDARPAAKRMRSSPDHLVCGRRADPLIHIDLVDVPHIDQVIGSPPIQRARQRARRRQPRSASHERSCCSAGVAGGTIVCVREV